MTLDPSRITRKHLRPAAIYAPGASPLDDPEAVRLDWNESPYSLSPTAQATFDAYCTGNRYPTFSQDALIEALARYTGAPASRIIAGAGLDDVFATLAIATIDVGDEVIISEPTFGVYRDLFETHGANVIDVPLGPAPDFALDVDGIIGMVSNRTKLVIVCNPNNPTGTLFGKDNITRIVSNVDCLVAIDEAYAEFSGTSHLDIANDWPNVVVLRTLSKFAGLAGFRVGYGIFPESLMPWIHRAAPAFYNISAISAAVATASLEDLDHLTRNTQMLVAERERLRTTMNAMPGVEAYDSAANFVLVALPVDDAGPVVEALAAHKVFVRRYSGDLRRCIRVSLGTRNQNDMFLEALGNALAAHTSPVQSTSGVAS
jgi:histidinol-phosphate aminotransferase